MGFLVILGFNLILFIILMSVCLFFENLLIMDILYNFSNFSNFSNEFNYLSNILCFDDDWIRKPSLELWSIEFNVYPTPVTKVAMPMPATYIKPIDYNIIIEKVFNHKTNNQCVINWFKISFGIDPNILNIIHYNNYMYNYYNCISYNNIIDKFSNDPDFFFRIQKNAYINEVIEWIVQNYYFCEHLKHSWCKLLPIEFDRVSWEIILKVENYAEKKRMLNILLVYLNMCIDKIDIDDDHKLNCRHSRIILKYLIRVFTEMNEGAK